jgi:hypothetical protein
LRNIDSHIVLLPGIAVDGDQPSSDGVHYPLALIKRKGKVNALVEEIASQSTQTCFLTNLSNNNSSQT